MNKKNLRKSLDSSIKKHYQKSILENVKMAMKKSEKNTCNVNKSKVYYKQNIYIYYERGKGILYIRRIS